MKKLFSLVIAGSLVVASLAFVNPVFAQDGAAETSMEKDTTMAGDSLVVEEVDVEEEVMAVDQDPANLNSNEEGASGAFNIEALKVKFIEGGPGFMGIVLVCLIFGLALTIERVIYLNLSTTNSDKLIQDIDAALSRGGVEDAKTVARNAKGPVASICYQALLRSDEGIDQVEKTIVAYGGVQMGLLEKGMSWISLFIALAPMLGFMGTVIGMIQAFDKIQATGEMSAGNVAGGIKVALLTTVFGLIVAIILQIGYNYLVAKIDSMVNDMENASIEMVDVLYKYNKK